MNLEHSLKTLVAGVSAVATVLLATPAVVQAEPGILHPIEMINCRPGCQEKLAQNKDRVQLFNVWSPKMERDVPIVVQPAQGGSAGKPTIYVLNGADGGEGDMNVIQQSNILDFYHDKANLVIVMAGQNRYYTDWYNQNPIFNRPYWETFLTEELPGPIEQQLQASGKRGIIGISMSVTSVTLLAERHPDLYQAVAGFSGCPLTSGIGEHAANFVSFGKHSVPDMWGPAGSEYRLSHDTALHVDQLRGLNIYYSVGDGSIGKYDPQPPQTADPTAWGRWAHDMYAIGAPLVVEAGANVCTREFKRLLDQQHISATWNFHTGSHSWGYWNDDFVASWPVFMTLTQ